MNNRGLFLKTFGGFGLLIVLLSGLTFLFTTSSIRSHDERRLALELERCGKALGPEIAGLLDGPSEILESRLKTLAGEVQARLTVIDPDGVVLGESERDPASMESHRYRPEVVEALAGRFGRSLRFSTTLGTRMMYVGLPIRRGDGEVRAVLRLSMLQRDVEVLVREVRGGVFRAILIGTVLALFASFLFALHLTRPIRALEAATRKVAGGDFAARVRIRRRDEFRLLGERFNAMTEKLATLFDDLLRQKEEMGNVLASIREGLAVVDRDGRIALANESFRSLVGDPEAVGRYLWEAVRNAGLQDLVARVRADRTARSDEYRLSGRQVLAAAGYLPARDGVALVLHDLSDLRKVEDMKRDFVINVSHELRTPLAAIAGAVELLEDESGGNDAAARDILRRHTERMRALVEDLLKLGEIESAGRRPEAGETDAAAAAARVVELFAARAAAKGLDLRLDAGTSLPKVSLDPYQIEQLLINLVDNAVKYTDKGGVIVRLRAIGRSLVLEVVDTGPGIPQKHLTRIFERFYTVDKSRSRSLGGTGLGLSIVKHIALLHGGTVDVRSEEGRGTTFVVRLPIDSSAD